MTMGLLIAGLPGLIAIPAFWTAGRILARS